ncbi:hypothetical protein LVD15_15295 [Fulvivirga maritima]|uniref:hypothetical protein n=1 Tax=Fulvivirga maritima TaxID=2904247 RepID=UPI001F3AE6C2|nr:hypothetical protein [Fulvivirga maritima]UII24679.1 hypothetical protein LVD15_15295 [Fulvivirga maritima]
MALDNIILEGDFVVFSPVFQNAVVAVKPGRFTTSGKTTVRGKKVGLKGDEKKLQVPNCIYSAGAFVNGQGTLTIKKLASNQLTNSTKSGQKPMILQGGLFEAEFKVDVKAVDVNMVQDPSASYAGFGKFIPANTKVKAS